MDSPPLPSPSVSALTDIISDDFEAFCKSRLWYKQLSYVGAPYLIFPFPGLQPKNPFHCPSDSGDNGHLHWWFHEANFIDEIPIHGHGKEIVMQNTVMLNCFLRGLEENGNMRGWFLVRQRHPELPDILRQKYPTVRQTDIESYAQLEQASQLEAAQKAARRIVTQMLAKAPEWLYGEVLESVGHGCASQSPVWSSPKLSSPYASSRPFYYTPSPESSPQPSPVPSKKIKRLSLSRLTASPGIMGSPGARRPHLPKCCPSPIHIASPGLSSSDDEFYSPTGKGSKTNTLSPDLSPLSSLDTGTSPRRKGSRAPSSPMSFITKRCHSHREYKSSSLSAKEDSKNPRVSKKKSLNFLCQSHK